MLKLALLKSVSCFITFPKVWFSKKIAMSKLINETTVSEGIGIIGVNKIGLKQWRAHCFSTQFGFGCLDLAFLCSCWVKKLTDRKDTLFVVISFSQFVYTYGREGDQSCPKFCPRGLYSALNPFVVQWFRFQSLLFLNFINKVTHENSDMCIIG